MLWKKTCSLLSADKAKKERKNQWQKDSQLGQELQPRLEDQTGLVDPEINTEKCYYPIKNLNHLFMKLPEK